MDEELFTSRLLETENLTDNLEDDDANTLLDWAVGQIKGIISNPLTAGERVDGLMTVLRKINRLVPDLGARSPQDVAAALAELAQTAEGAFGWTPPAGVEDLQNLAEKLHSASTAEAVQALLDWLNPHGGGQAA